MKKVKVAYICYLSCSIVREQLDLYPESKRYRYRDANLWNLNVINGLKNRDDIELFVISHHRGMEKASQEFDIEGVHYYYYRDIPPYPWGGIEERLCSQAKRNYPRARKYAKKIIDSIKPDIVDLVGAEIAWRALIATDVENIPVIIHLQTVYANPDREKNAGKVNKQRWDAELGIFHKTPYMALNARRYYDLVKGYVPEAIIFPRKWPNPKFPDIPVVEKKYDFVFFARYLNKNKGFDNAVEAMGIFLKVHPEAKLLAVGSKDTDWPMIENRIEELGIKSSLEIHKTIIDYREMLQFVRQGRFSLLPITMDVVSGTILESMRMGMPVVTCRTSGTPSLNQKRKTVLISDIGDSEALAQNMLKLYESPELQEELIANGELYMKEMDEENAKNADIMVNQYRAVIEHYYQGKPIPQELLFDKNTLFI